ncbi:hypothetical protein KP509_10G076000 [Ceratopteris richardii]|uniref:peptidylprolyl isomerase n=1 Tax=Ceratopteris richardii TaxID=49495 RepID=A0A8T2U394_CERRI|nr:hypothetical protein KP509_10G076000 [Ceratopteris richardii]
MSASMSLSLCSSIHGAAAGKKLVSFCGFSMEKTPEDGQRKRKQMMKAVLCCRISDHLISKRSLLLSLVGPAPLFIANPPAFSAERPQFRELEGSGGLKAIDIREGSGRVPQAGDKVIEGLDKAVQSMKEGGVRRVIIPPQQGYQNTVQEPIPPNVFDRQRLYTTIFNPTRLANGEGSTLGTLIFDIELLKIRSNN